MSIPSLEISINKNEKVLSVNAVNEDAKGILDGMDLAGTDLKVSGKRSYRLYVYQRLYKRKPEFSAGFG